MQHLLRLLSDPTRVRILVAVESEELSVGELADVLGMGQTRISNHLRLLRDGKALRARREGAWTFYRTSLDAGEAARTSLWEAVKEGLKKDPAIKADAARRRAVLERRRRRSKEHFADDGAPVSLETGSLREEILAALAPQGWVVVDAGCGDGFLTEILSERFAKVRAFDHSPARLAAARRRVKGNGVVFETGEVDALPLRAGSTDAVFFSMVLHHVPEVGEALREARRVLRPGGRLVVADLAPHHEEVMRDKMGDLRLGLEPETLAQAVRDAGFETVRVLPVRDRLVVGRNTALELILVEGRRPLSLKTPGRKRRQKKN
ncbi:MAG: ArsR/SmtB family transcription factor [Planctomycetota bacterium]|jgi:ArsR family transcriptional regulator